MSQTKVQLIAPIGVVTATTLETTGVLTATTFVGDIAGTVTGITSTTDNLNLGIITATSFAGDFTGIGSGLTGTPNVVAGVVTATKFVGNTPGTVSGIADGTNINAGIITATSFVGNLTGNAAGLSTTTAHVNLGIVTATSYHGSGANLDGVSSGPVAQQAVTANGATTTIDLSSGNLIYMTQSANTTVAFANTEGNTDTVYLVRIKDDNTTERTITWPSGMVWNGGSEPTLLSDATSNEGQIFKLTTRDNGATWYGSEVYNNAGGYTLWVWGANFWGYLGQNQTHNTAHRSSPIQVGTEDSWSKLNGSFGITSGYGVGLKSNGTLWSWGYNGTGNLGLNNKIYYSSPVQVPGTTWKSVTVSRSSNGVKTDGTLWSWGYNVYGQLGQNNRQQYSSPTQIGSGTDWNFVGEGNASTTQAIKTDGTLWMMGSNNNGILGQNTSNPGVSNISSPVQVAGSWSKITQVQDISLGIQTDGTLWSWGSGYDGGGGHGDYVDRSSPTKIGSGTDWSDIGAGYNSCAAIKTDGTLWTWGNNAQGSLGLNDRTTRNSPVQVPGTTWKSVEGSYNWMMAVKTDGTLWGWGNNDYGKLGTNNQVYYSSPVQCPGTNWLSVSVQKDNVAALRS